MTTATTVTHKPTATPNIRFRDPALEPVWEKIQDGERISFEDGLSCLQTSDLVSLGQMADYAKRRLWGERVYFVFNRHINPTNICVLSCTFCDFAKKKGDAGAYEMEMDEILGKLHPDMHEVHIVGGHHPDWPFERYEGIVRGIHQAYPSIHIKAWTAAEIDYFCKRFKMSEEEVLGRMKDAGLVSMPAAVRRSSRLECAGSSSPERTPPSAGWRFTAWHTQWASAPTPRSSTATSRRWKSACTT